MWHALVLYHVRSRNINRPQWLACHFPMSGGRGRLRKSRDRHRVSENSACRTGDRPSRYCTKNGLPMASFSMAVVSPLNPSPFQPLPAILVSFPVLKHRSRSVRTHETGAIRNFVLLPWYRVTATLTGVSWTWSRGQVPGERLYAGIRWPLIKPDVGIQ